MSENIVWSTKSCSLKTFVQSYTLPQLVKVEDGFCSEDDAETLSTGEILMLHSVTKLLMEDADDRQYFVSRSCQCKVEILPTTCQDRYYSVEDVVDAFTYSDLKFIRVVEVHTHSPSLRIKAGDILKLRRTVEQHFMIFLECLFYGSTEYLVRLPLDFKAVFEPLARKEAYSFQEVIDSFEFPVRVKVKSNCKTRDSNNNQSRGSVLLKSIRRESKIIATIRDNDMTPVLLIPTDLDVNVCPARGAILGEKEYTRYCKAIHDSTKLSDNKLFENSPRLCECFEDPVEEEYENNEVVDLLRSQTIQDSQRLSIPKLTNPEQDMCGHVLTTSNDNPCNTLNERSPPRPPPAESLPRSKPPRPPKRRSSQQRILGEYWAPTLNQNLPCSTDEQAPPPPPRVESLSHRNATGADKDDDYHHYEEIPSPVRNLNLAPSRTTLTTTVRMSSNDKKTNTAKVKVLRETRYQ